MFACNLQNQKACWREVSNASPSTKSIQKDVEQKIEQFAGQVVTELAAAMAGVMTNLEHKLGL